MMADLVLLLVLLLDLRLLAASRLGACIRSVALQGLLLGFFPLVTSHHPAQLRVMALATGTMILKGLVFPRLLFRALREADVSREVEPQVGYAASLLLGLPGLLVSFWLRDRLPLGGLPVAPLVIPVAVFSILTGLFLIVARQRAVHQVLGFLVLENGIYAFGVGVMEETSLLVEVGVLLDVLVALFVMGIMIFHINREFDHIDTDRLSTLKD